MDLRDLVQPRRIVTGTDDAGHSYAARIEDVEQVDYEYVLPPTPRDFDSKETAPAFGDDDKAEGAPHGFFRIWGADWLPIPLPTDGRTPYFDVAPTPQHTPAELRRASILPPPLGVRIGLGISPGGGPPGRMHWTDSTDILFIMSGKHGQILDEGEVLMHPGDVLVQNGTMHSHQTMEHAVMGYVTLTAMRTQPPPPIHLMNPVSGPPEPYRGGYRQAEIGTKEPMSPWQVPGATPRPYKADDLPERIEEMVRPRRVVTGTNDAGRSFFSRVEHVDEVDYAATGADADGQLWRIWQTDRLPDLVPTDGKRAPLACAPGPDETPEALRTAPLEPPPLGVVVTIQRIPPGGTPGPKRQRDVMDAVFIMCGEPTLILDNDQVALRPGDVLIQNGTSHQWHNSGSTPVVLGVASFSGVRYGT